MIEAYIDESGIHDGAKVCVVAGYVGGRGQWRRFELQWRRLLATYSIPLSEFHAKDFVKKTRHATFLRSAAKLMRSFSKIHPIAAGVFVDDFMSFPVEHRMYLTGADVRQGRLLTTGAPYKPYFLPFQFCIQMACDYAPVGGKVHFFLGIDRPFAGWATSLFSQMRSGEPQQWKEQMGTIAFPLAKETPELQAADLLVHLTYQHILSATPDVSTAQPSPLLADCIHNRRHDRDFFVQNRTHLEIMFNQAAELSRRRRAARNVL